MAAHLAFNTLLTAVAAAMVLVACDRDDNSTGGQKLNSGIANTAEVGAVVVTKIEKKSAMTRRVVIGFAAPT